jgi:hypothetical protein
MRSTRLKRGGSLTPCTRISARPTAVRKVSASDFWRGGTSKWKASHAPRAVRMSSSAARVSCTHSHRLMPSTRTGYSYSRLRNGNDGEVQPRRRGGLSRSSRGTPSVSRRWAASVTTSSTSVSGRLPARFTAHVASRSPN